MNSTFPFAIKEFAIKEAKRGVKDPVTTAVSGGFREQMPF